MVREQFLHLKGLLHADKWDVGRETEDTAPQNLQKSFTTQTTIEYY